MSLDILLVEDNDGDARLVREVLLQADNNVRIHRVNDGLEAMQFLRYQKPYLDAPRPNLILLDLNMPKMDGREVLVKVKEDPWLRTIPVIVLSTSEAEPDIVQSYKLLATSYVPKTNELAEFEKVVKNLMTAN